MPLANMVDMARSEHSVARRGSEGTPASALRADALRVAGLHKCPNERGKALVMTGCGRCLECDRHMSSGTLPVLFAIRASLLPASLPAEYREK